MRYVLASTRRDQLVGGRRAADPERDGVAQGSLIQGEPLSRQAALVAFDSSVRGWGAFSIETRDGSTVAMHVSETLLGSLLRRLRGQPPRTVALDIWCEVEPEPPLEDVIIVDVATARSFVALAFEDVADSELWSHLRVGSRAA